MTNNVVKRTVLFIAFAMAVVAIVFEADAQNGWVLRN
jgi:hypothetical protein